MQLPLTDSDTLFEELLQDLPAEVCLRAAILGEQKSRGVEGQ